MEYDQRISALMKTFITLGEGYKESRAYHEDLALIDKAIGEVRDVRSAFESMMHIRSLDPEKELTDAVKTPKNDGKTKNKRGGSEMAALDSPKKAKTNQKTSKIGGAKSKTSISTASNPEVKDSASRLLLNDLASEEEPSVAAANLAQKRKVPLYAGFVEGEWILCFGTRSRKVNSGYTRLRDADLGSLKEYEIEDSKRVILKQALQAKVTVGDRVMSIYPQTTVFYMGEITQLDAKNCWVKFDGDTVSHKVPAKKFMYKPTDIDRS